MSLLKTAKSVLSLLERKKQIMMDEHIFNYHNKAAIHLCLKKQYPELSSDEISEICKFWGKYGIRFSDYSWFKMFYSETGIHDPRFIPHSIAYVLYSHFNNRIVDKGWDDKNFYDRFVPAISFPESLCHYVNANFYDGEWNIYECTDESLMKLSDRILKQLGDDNCVIYKKTTNTSFGQGVKKYVVNNANEISSLLKKLSINDGFMLQRCVKQHDFLKQFNESSVNIFRIVTFRHKGKYYLLSVSLRYGTEGYATDVAFINGEEIVNVIGIDENGVIKNSLFGVDGKKNFDKYDSIKDKKVPCFEELKKAAIEGHKCLPHFDHVAWDFTIDNNGHPVCIEYNINIPGSQLYQFSNGPLYGELTEEVLECLKLEKNRLKIPAKLRI